MDNESYLSQKGVSMSQPVIGFIGLGIMGKPMARNLTKTGYALVVHSRSRPPVEEIGKEGAKIAGGLTGSGFDF